MPVRSRFDRLGPTQKKILLLLLGGVGLSLAGSPKKYFGVIKSIADEWSKINEYSLRRAVRLLYQSKLVETRENENGSLTLVLTENGKRKALTYNMDSMAIKKPKRWDGKWRMVLFDIPDKKKRERETLRSLLQNLGFIKYQESAFIIPYPCKDEMNYVIEFFDLRPHVRLLEVSSCDDDLAFKQKFGLLA